MTTVQFNQEWRRIVASALQFYWKHGKSELALDNEDFLDDLLEDLYTVESTGTGLITRLNKVDLNTDKTTTSTTRVMVTGSNFSHTPQKTNMTITAFNLVANQSGANEFEIVPRFNGLEGIEVAPAVSSGTIARYLSAVAKFEGLTPNIAHDVSLYWKVSGGSATLFSATHILFLIEEYDD